MKLLQYLPTALSLCRIPLATLFFFDNSCTRVLAVVGSIFTDVADGYIARRYGVVTKLGTYIDPITDKLFVFTALAVFHSEGKIDALSLGAFLLRDISLIFFSIILVLLGTWKVYEVKSFFLGKVMTSLQFLILILLSANQKVYPFLYASLALIGILCFANLFWKMKQESSSDTLA